MPRWSPPACGWRWRKKGRSQANCAKRTGDASPAAPEHRPAGAAATSAALVALAARPPSDREAVSCRPAGEARRTATNGDAAIGDRRARDTGADRRVVETSRAAAPGPYGEAGARTE